MANVIQLSTQHTLRSERERPNEIAVPVSGIHDLDSDKNKDVDGRNKSGHDARGGSKK